ncbi:uncharacterized mitochondrial protein-like protein [Tanacetum coccineum]
MESVKETVKIRVCKGGAWERVDGALEYMPLNCVKRTLILPLLSSYSCLLEAVSERLEIDANSDFMVTYNSDNDIVEVCDDLEVNEFMEFVVKSSRIVTLCIVESGVNDMNASSKLIFHSSQAGELNVYCFANVEGSPQREFFGSQWYLAVAMDGNISDSTLAYGVFLQYGATRKTSEIREGGHNGEMLTQEYVRKITEEASEDDHFTRGPWLSAVQYLAAEGVLNDEVYGKAISVGAVLILRNVSVFSPKSSGHYLNITLKNMVKVFHKDTSAVNSGSGASTSRESYWAVEI